MSDALSLSTTAAPLAAAKLEAHARRHQFCAEDLEWSQPFDRSAGLLCPTLTPLYYTPSYAELSEPQRLRYNQLMGVCAVELIGWLERSLQPMLQALIDDERLPVELRKLFPGFIHDEQRHAEVWAKLNRLAEPQWYTHGDVHVLRVPPLARGLLLALSRHPASFPVVVWTVLALEEHALELTRRSIRAETLIESRFRRAYRLHAQDEARHVQIDWTVLETLLARLGPLMLRINVRLFRAVVDRFLLRPANIAVRVARQLVAEFADLAPREGAMIQQLRGLSTSAAYREMIFSPRSHPISFRVIERFAVARDSFADLM